MKYHVRVFDLDTKEGNTIGQYVLAGGVTLDTYLEAETEAGYHLETMDYLPNDRGRLMRVVTVHNGQESS